MNFSSSSRKRGRNYFVTKFPCKLCLKMSVTMIMQFYLISVKHGSTLKVTILIILITDIYNVVTNHGIALLVPQCSFHLVI